MTAETTSQPEVCLVCREPFVSGYSPCIVLKPCGHKLCQVCYDIYVSAHGYCPLCYTTVETYDVIESSSKVEELLSSNSCCTFARNGYDRIQQTGFICHTCDLYGQPICSNCALVCHEGHSLEPYEGGKPFYCTCGKVKCYLLGEIEPPLRCTYIETGHRFVSQVVYRCATCNLTGNYGCCEFCARVCHEGHELECTGNSDFYCDCAVGHNGVVCHLMPTGPENS